MTLQLGSRSVHCGAKKRLGDVAVLLVQTSIGCGIILSLLERLESRFTIVVFSPLRENLTDINMDFEDDKVSMMRVDYGG